MREESQLSLVYIPAIQDHQRKVEAWLSTNYPDASITFVDLNWITMEVCKLSWKVSDEKAATLMTLLWSQP
jgi:hypothetical protein